MAEDPKATDNADPSVPVRTAEIPHDLKKSVVWEALKGGVAPGANLAVSVGFLNVLKQQTDPELKGLRRLLSKRETFEFNSPSFSKWVATGLGIGFVAGAIASGLGAVHHNREVQKWAERETSETPNPASAGLGK